MNSSDKVSYLESHFVLEKMCCIYLDKCERTFHSRLVYCLHSCAGGEVVSESNSTPLSVVEMYDSRQNRWIVKRKMTRRRHGCGACSLNGKIYVVGGYVRHYI